jgi:type II secretory ATPase GspE/PulE/Tfp pilus assembly ATPase PilB-like protein
MPIGELLVRTGQITQAELDAALAFKEERGMKLGQALVALHLVTQSELAHALRTQGAIHCVELERAIVDEHVARELGEERSRQFQAVAFNKIAGVVSVAIEDPSETYHVDAISLAMNAPVFAVHAEPGRIASCIDAVFGAARRETPASRAETGGRGALHALAREEEPRASVASAHDTSLDAAATSFVRNLLDDAYDAGASDVHLEPRPEGLHVRFRIEGTLRERSCLPRAWALPVLARLKLIANLDVGECRLPQEGKTSAEIHGRRAELLVATAPTMHGEGAVLRMLEGGRRLADLGSLPLNERQRADLAHMTAGGGGLVLAAGPSGQGRTSTLYALVRELDATSRKIITVEDPVEDPLDGVTQMHVNARIGLTFVRAVRAALQQDPDVLLIGEIRDAETAEVALQAALAGKLVFATLHAPGASESITRLVDMGLEPYLLADALRGVVAQRLVRRLCEHCRRPARATPELQLRLALRESEQDGWEAPGCEHCGESGFRGRIALYEVLRADHALWDAIRLESAAQRLREIARASGWTTLREDGVAKARAGETTFDEVYAATARG